MLDKVTEYLLISLLAFMPFAFGAVDAWSEEIVITIVAAISITFLVRLIFIENSRWILLSANYARLAEARWKKALADEHRLAEKNWAGSDQEYIATRIPR